MKIRINSGCFDINDTQLAVMRIIDGWVRTQKTPVPRKQVVKAMQENGVGESTTKASLKVLLAKGYIRRGVTTSTKVIYVKLRGI
jgi:hypothetical protein